MMVKEKYEEEIKPYDELVASEPDNPIVWYRRAIVKAVSGRNEQAIIDFDKAIKLKPDYINAHLKRGVANYSLGRFDPEDYREAIKDFDEVIRLNPDNAGAWFFRGLAKRWLYSSNEEKESPILKEEARSDWRQAFHLYFKQDNHEMRACVEKELRILDAEEKSEPPKS